MARSLHLHNARIWTGNPRRPWADSLTIEAGRVTASRIAGPLRGPGRAGGSRAAQDSPGPARQQGDELVIDARGRTVTPGLIDAHLHLLQGGRSLTELDLSGVRSRAEFEAAIAGRHVALPPGEWLIAGGWSQENWGGQVPDKSWLGAAGARPVVCTRMDIHAALVNDAVLRLCARERESDSFAGADLERGSDPFSGRGAAGIVRDPATGAPTGLMLEAAAWKLVNPLVPKPSIAQRRQHLLQAQRLAHSFGLTAVGSMEHARDVADVYAPIHDEGRLTLRCRITLLDREIPGEPARPRAVHQTASGSAADGAGFPARGRAGSLAADTPVLAVIGCKTFIDGTLGSRTARMLRDYADDPGNCGMLVELAAEGGPALHDWIRAVANAGLSPSIHAIGDEAARIALDAIESLDAGTRRRVRPRIEHAQQIDPADFPRFARGGGGDGGGIVTSMQPLHKADDARYVRRRLGAERLAGTFAFRSLLTAGARLAFGSDWPVVSPDPMRGIRAAVTGLTLDGEVFAPEQNLTVEEAMRAYTVDAAYALGLDDIGAGRLAVDGAGDFVMFDRDPFAAHWRDAPPKVIMTVVGGEVVYGAEEVKGESRAREAASGLDASR